MTQTYTQTVDTMGNPQMEPVPAGDWIRAEDHAAALATARDDALREAKDAVGGIDLGFHDGISGDWHGYSGALVAFSCFGAVSALLGQPAPPSADQVPEVVGYTNYRGEHSYRSIIPQRVWYGSTEYHPNPQWFLKAFDTDKQGERDFALCDFGEAPRTISPCEQCCVCGADVDTCEVSEGGGPDGAQLSGGKWVCSSECFDAAPADKPVHFYAYRKTPETLTAAKVTDIPAPPREVTVQELAASPLVQALVDAGERSLKEVDPLWAPAMFAALAAFKETEE